MAHSTLAALSLSEFPQTLSAALDHQITRVCSIVDQRHLGQCWFADEHCDCKALATVHPLGSDFEYCLRHFQMLEKAAQ